MYLIVSYDGEIKATAKNLETAEDLLWSVPLADEILTQEEYENLYLPEVIENNDVIRKLQSTLIRIDNGERFFFNITQLTNLGLIHGIDRYKPDSSGNVQRIRTDWYLTNKGKRIVNTAI